VTAWAGSFALSLGFAAALASVALWSRAAVTGRGAGGGRSAVALMAAGALGAVGAVEWALLHHDFSLRFVAENGSRATPTYYTVTSLWSAHDGSMLLWVLVLTGYTCVVAFRPRRGPRAPTSTMHAWAMAVLGTVAAFFFGLALLTGHVFETVSPVPADGPGPDPLLADHPAMGVHPPLLYLGLVGMVVPFAFAVAGLITGDVGRRWLEAVRGYALVAWTALTAGIVMGAWWSYAVLGWGGYWAWDPVENASLLPWLVATALLHSSMVQRRRQALPAWNLALAATAFCLSCLGTFLTRSGVVASVHSFAYSSVGPLLLGFVCSLAAGVAVLVVLRSDRLGPPSPIGPVLSRGSAILANNVLLATLTLTVLIGTLFPVLAEAAAGQQLSVGSPYFDKTAVPVFLVLLVLMAIGPMLHWDGEQPGRLLDLLVWPVLAGCAVVIGLVATGTRGTLPLAVFGIAGMVVSSIVLDTVGAIRRTARRHRHGLAAALAAWAGAHRARNAGMLVHLGVVLLAVGVAASSAYTVASEVHLTRAHSVTRAGVQTELLGVTRSRDAQETVTSARLRVTRSDGTSYLAQPALRYFPAQDTTVTTPSVTSRVGGDVYLTLLSVAPGGGSATVRVAANPLVDWIWAGGALMALGGLLSLRARRHRRTAEAVEPASPTAEPVLVPQVEAASR
jgi:cytochrome c-type biogenesis protein CcmF